MRQREHIEGDLIQITALLHDLALGGISAANLNEISLLTEAVNKLTGEAEGYVPQVIHINPRAANCAGAQGRLLTGTGA